MSPLIRLCPAWAGAAQPGQIRGQRQPCAWSIQAAFANARPSSCKMSTSASTVRMTGRERRAAEEGTFTSALRCRGGARQH
jgi:hypothetical protein